MAHIHMTDCCNLKCPYCFANEFVNHDVNEISEEAFHKAIEFILTGKDEKKIGLIGGEPLLHSQFEKLASSLLEIEKLERIVIYTNGVFIDKYLNLLSNEKFGMLINCNNANDIGQIAYDRMVDNIDKLIDTRGSVKGVFLGINMYKTDFEYEYLVELLKKHHMRRVRISITVPNTDERRMQAPLIYFKEIKDRMIEFFEVCLSNDILPCFDCNKMPACVFTEKDVVRIENAFANSNRKIKDVMSVFHNVRCNPVVDILPDLTAVRCFGMSESTKVKINKFQSFDELYRYYLGSVDDFAFQTTHSGECRDCYDRITRHCMGGCLAYKARNIQNVIGYCRQQMEGVC